MASYNKDWRLWALLFITITTGFLQGFSTFIIHGNDIKHLRETITEFKQEVKNRFDIIEDYLWRR